MSDDEKVAAIDAAMSHIWMVRTFLKHSEEAEEDDELRGVHRELYDAMHAVGPALATGDPATYLKQVKKKLGRLQRATNLFLEIQPEVSGHTNFVMAARSLESAVARIRALLAD